MQQFAEGADYDSGEQNRKMIPVSANIGYFRLNGFIKMAELTKTKSSQDKHGIPE